MNLDYTFGKFPLVVIMLFSFSFYCYSDDSLMSLSVKISHESEGIMNSAPGIPLSALLEFWPQDLIENKKEDIREGTFLGEFIYIAKIDSIKSSINNSDVTQIRGTFVFLKKMEMNTPLLLIWKGMRLPFYISRINLDIGPFPEMMDKKFVIMENNFKSDAFYKRKRLMDYAAYFIVSIFLLVFIGLIIKKIKKVLLKKREREKAKEVFDIFINNIKSASTRREFEDLYEKKLDWGRFVDTKGIYFNKFITFVETNQYKMNWSKENLLELKEVVDKLKKDMVFK